MCVQPVPARSRAPHWGLSSGTPVPRFSARVRSPPSTAIMRHTSPRFRPRFAMVFCAAAIGLLGACSGITDAESGVRRYGAVNFVGKRTATGQGSAQATVVAFESVGLQVPNSALQQNDQCLYTVVDTVTPVARGDRSAGASVSILVAGTTRALPYSASEFRYATAADAPIIYNAGDVAQVSLPGNGDSFPPIAGSVKLAEPLELGPVTLPTGGGDLTVTWNGTNDPSAAIILQLKYANPATSTFANEQIYCALRDDGTVVLPGGLLNPFQLATTRRSLTLIRWRTNYVPTDAVNLHLTTSVDTTVTFP